MTALFCNWFSLGSTEFAEVCVLVKTQQKSQPGVPRFERLCKPNPQLSQHCERVNITYMEWLTYIWDRDFSSCITRQNFMRHDGTPFGHSISHQPAIRTFGEICLGGASEYWDWPCTQVIILP